MSSSSDLLLDQPQVARPETHYRVFTPISRTAESTEDVVAPSVYCSDCQQVRQWYQDNLEMVRNWITLHGDKEHEEIIKHKPTANDLVNSSRRGCHMCTIMVESLLVFGNRIPGYTPDANDRVDQLLKKADSYGPVTAVIHISPKRYGNKADRSHAKIIPKVPLSSGFSNGDLFHGATIVPKLTPRSSIPRPLEGKGWPVRTDSRLCFDQIKEWLDRCTRTHIACGRLATETLPTRLLFVSRDGQYTKCQLIHTNTISVKADVRYVVLSYCWGNTATVKLTNDTRASLLQGVDAQCLPMTIQDAISVTLELGLSFIWVDSLCIIQDSVEDWKREAATMSDVYLGSFVCVAGRGASNNSEGLFALRDPLRQSPCTLIDNPEDDHSLTVWPALQASQPWPLESRGWVLQERALPPRMVKFGSYVCWECRECAADEFELETHDPKALPALPGAHEHMIKEFYNTIIDPSRSGKLDEAAVLVMWRALVDEYSNTALTQIADKHTAIGGLVAAARKSLGWTPEWGLWGEHMFEGMYWSVASETKVSRTGVGPTWSWLSVDGFVVHYGPTESTDIAAIQTDEARADLGDLPDELQDQVISVTSHVLHAQDVEETQHGLLSRPTEWSSSSTETITWRLDLGDLDAHPVAECLFLPLRQGTSLNTMQLCGIVVSPSLTHKGFYERCGDWDIHIWKNEENKSAEVYKSLLDVVHKCPRETVKII